MLAKCLQQSIILTYQVFCALNPWSLQGSHDSLLPSISRHLEKFTILTNQIFHTLKMSLYASVRNNAVVMWPFFIEPIASFCIKITQGKFLWHKENTGNFILARMWPPYISLFSFQRHLASVAHYNVNFVLNVHSTYQYF